MKIFQDSNEKYCLAKICYMFVLLYQAVLICHNEIKGLDVDYSGLSMYLVAVGGVYFGRSHTKAKGQL